MLRRAYKAYNLLPPFACSGQEVTLKDQFSRRHFTKLAIGAAIVGFNPDERSWITQDNTARPFDRLPRLDGTLLLDEESRRAIATDEGYMFHRVPAAVLRPGSVQDVVAMVRYANQHKLKVAIRGNGHSRYGQTQAEAGMVAQARNPACLVLAVDDQHVGHTQEFQLDPRRQPGWASPDD